MASAVFVLGACDTDLVAERPAPAVMRLPPSDERLSYPNLSNVPDGPPRRPTDGEHRARMIESLQGAPTSGDSRVPGEPVPPATVMETSERANGGSGKVRAAGAGAKPGDVQLAQASGTTGGDNTGPAIEINRSQIPQMDPSEKGQPVELPGSVNNQQREQTNANAPAGERIAVIYFAHGQAELDGKDRGVLRKVATIHDRTGRPLRVVGHASSQTRTLPPVKHRMVNFDMSMRRAENVANALNAMGVPANAVVIQARGNRDPVYHEFMPTGATGNQRTEIFLRASR